MTVTLPAHGDSNWDTPLNTAMNGIDTRLTTVEGKAVTAGALTNSFIPATTNAYALGSSTKRFSSLYVGTSVVFPDGTVQTTAVGTPGPAGATGPAGPTGPTGASFTPYYGAFQDSTTQTIASTTTAYTITFNTVDFASNGVTRGTPTSRIVFANAGTYNIQWSGQFENSINSDQDVSVWLRVNGVDVAGSTGIISIPASHGAVNGHTIAGWNFFLGLTAGQYVELIWTASSTAVSLAGYAAGTSPTRPSTASVVFTANRVS